MWKTKLGICIYESSSGYKVYQNWGYRWLTLGSDALQTVIKRNQPDKPVLYYLHALTLMAKKYPGSSCLLGLGGAAVALILADIPLIAIDCSQEVIDIAKRFFMIEQLKHLTVIKENARDYVLKCETSYAHLLIDLYNAQQFPPECAHDEFFSSCKNILIPEGFLAINLANIKEQWPILQLIKKHFTHTLLIPVEKSANMIILASKSERGGLFINQIRKTGAFKRILWVNFWGYVGEYGILTN